MADDEFQVRVGRIGHRRSGQARSFIGQALAAAARAGGVHLPSLRRPSTFGQGRAASLLAGRGLGRQARRVVVKARVVRKGAGRAPLGLHLDYLRREGVGPAQEAGRLFDAGSDAAAGSDFAGRCEEDRHHFRFIVSPEDAEQMADLRAFTRDLMAQAEHDLGTRLDWVAADHWNTVHPHVHILVRGKDASGEDLVISRDYIREGLRGRAGRLVTLELGPRTELEQQRALERQVQADRWTPLDRHLRGRAASDGLVDLRASTDAGRRAFDRVAVARLHRLEAMGLAQEERPGRWRLVADLEPALRDIGRQSDVIACIHQAMAAGRVGAGAEAAPFGEAPHGWTGRLIGRGLDDELKGTAYAIIDGTDGRVRHVPLSDLVNAADAPLGAVVEVRRSGAERARPATNLWVRSDLALADQVQARGATWLDRQLVAREPLVLAEAGFGGQVRAALAGRVDHLATEGLAQRRGGQVVLARDLLATLRARDLDEAGQAITRETGLRMLPNGEGPVEGVYRRRLDLASGRFAMLQADDGFALVPWQPSLERHLGQAIRGEVKPGGGIRWSLDATRGLGR